MELILLERAQIGKKHRSSSKCDLPGVPFPGTQRNLLDGA
jgi:hypothetical protein